MTRTTTTMSKIKKRRPPRYTWPGYFYAPPELGRITRSPELGLRVPKNVIDVGVSGRAPGIGLGWTPVYGQPIRKGEGAAHRPVVCSEKGLVQETRRELRRAFHIDDSSSPYAGAERTIAGRNVLVAISNPRMSERIKRVLEKQRYVVVQTDRPHEVLATAFRIGFDLLFVDAETGPDGGATLCRRLREAGVRTPIIILSAAGTAAEAAQTIDAGADDVIPRPMATSELLARVRAVRRRDSGPLSSRLRAGISGSTCHARRR
jgi:CheY-like chemotaxis protein